MRSHKLVLFALVMIASLIFVNVGKPYDLAYANAKTNDTKQCETLYVQYLDLGEYKFSQKYSYLYTINKCLSLYKDPTWTFSGKNKLDQQFQRILSTQNTLQSKNPNDFKASAEITSEIRATQGKYLVNFNICTGKIELQIPAVLLKSDLDSFVAVSKKSIPAGVCKSFQTGIDSKYSDKIEIKILESTNDISKYWKIKQV